MLYAASIFSACMDIVVRMSHNLPRYAPSVSRLPHKMFYLSFYLVFLRCFRILV